VLYKTGAPSEPFFSLSCLHSHRVWRCQGNKKDLDGDLSKLPRTRELTELLVDEWAVSDLWDKFGIVSDIVVCNLLLFNVVAHLILKPFTNDFERADIHELLAPDLLHQLIKGTFKDHLVDWVQDYINAHNSESRAKAIMDDIDRR
jgi:hypothetical protein